METNLLLLAIGLLAGTYGVMVGAGGGKIFVPALLILLKLQPEVAAGTGLCVVFLTSISGITGYIRQKRIDYKLGGILAAGAVPGIFIGIWLAHLSTPKVFYSIFALLLVGLGIFLILKKLPKPKDGSANTEISGATDSMILEFTGNNIFRLILVGSLLGVVSGFFGMGGGWLLVPILIYLFRVSPYYATATSVFALCLYSTLGVAINIYNGDVHWGAVIWGGIGVLAGAQIGVVLSKKISGKRIVQMLAVILIVIGVKLIFSAG